MARECLKRCDTVQATAGMMKGLLDAEYQQFDHQVSCGETRAV